MVEEMAGGKVVVVTGVVVIPEAVDERKEVSLNDDGCIMDVKDDGVSKSTVEDVTWTKERKIIITILIIINLQTAFTDSNSYQRTFDNEILI